MEKGASMEQQALALIPTGMGKSLAACPFCADDYSVFAQQLDTLIMSLSRKERNT